MAFIFTRNRNGKKHFFIAWFDLCKGAGNAGRCDISCKKYGAVNGEQRKILLKQFQDRENKLAFEIENNLFSIKPKDYNLSELAASYVDNMSKLGDLRKNHKDQGISKSHFKLIVSATKCLIAFFNDKNIILASQINSSVLRTYPNINKAF